MPFLKNGRQEGKTDPVWELVPVEGVYKERVKKAEYVKILCTHV
jgi:hypothetical protein